MTQVVVDASIVGLFLLSDEIDASSARIREHLLQAELLFAAHWQLEIASLLVKAARRQRMLREDYEARLAEVGVFLEAGSVELAAPPRVIFDLAMATGLTAYDTVYLELALRLRATLASNDDALIAVARTRGIPVVTTRS